MKLNLVIHRTHVEVKPHHPSVEPRFHVTTAQNSLGDIMKGQTIK